MSLAARAIAGFLFLASAVMLATPYAPFAPGLVFAFAGIVLLWHRPALGVICLGALVPLEGAFPDQPLISGAKLVGGAILLVVAMQLVLRKIPADRLGGAVWRALAAFLAVYMLSFAASMDAGASLLHARQLSIGLVVFLVTLPMRDRLDLDWLARAVVLTTTATCALALADMPPDPHARATGLMADPNYFALLLAFAFPLAAMLASDAATMRGRLAWLASTGLLAAGLVASDSRSGFVVLVAVAAALAWHHRGAFGRLRARHFGWLVLLAGIGLPLAAAVVPASYVERIQSLALMDSGIRSYEDTSLGRRMSYLLVGVDVIREDPLIGSGPGTYAGHYGRSSYAAAFSTDSNEPDFFRRAHNTYLELTAETGLFGGACFAALVGTGLWGFWRARALAMSCDDRILARHATHFGIAFLALALFLLFLSVPNHKYLWMSLALSAIVQARARRSAARATPA